MPTEIEMEYRILDHIVRRKCATTKKTVNDKHRQRTGSKYSEHAQVDHRYWLISRGHAEGPNSRIVYDKG